MPIVSGAAARVIISNPSRYQQALFSMAQTVNRILSFAFFYNRLTEQLRHGGLSSLEVEQARVCRVALYESSIISVHTLVDTPSNTWNFEQLFKEWKHLEHDEAKQQRVYEAISSLKVRMQRVSKYRHTRGAHKNKSVPMNEIIAPARQIPYIGDAVQTLDYFVSTPIPYTLYLLGDSRELDLRDALGIS